MKNSEKMILIDGNFAYGDRYFVRCQISDALFERLYEYKSLNKLKLEELWEMLIETQSKIIIYDKKLYLAHLIVNSVFSVEEIIRQPKLFLQLVNALIMESNPEIIKAYVKLVSDEISMTTYLDILASMKFKRRELVPLKKKAQSLLATANPHLQFKQTVYYENGKCIISIGQTQRGEVEAVNQACHHLSELFSHVLSIYQQGTEHQAIQNQAFKEASQILNFFPSDNLEMFLGMEDMISLRLLKNYT